MGSMEGFYADTAMIGRKVFLRLILEVMCVGSALSRFWFLVRNVMFWCKVEVHLVRVSAVNGIILCSAGEVMHELWLWKWFY